MDQAAGQRATKSWTLRVIKVPAHLSREEFYHKLQSLAPAGTRLDYKTVTLVPVEKHYAIATATFETELPVKDLVEQLANSPQNDGKYWFDDNFDGLTPLFEHEDSQVDVIAVHGWAGHAIGTWKFPKTNNVWLRDWLPEEMGQNKIRLLVYGYHTPLMESKSYDSIIELGEEFHTEVRTFYSKSNTPEERRPMILIGHSLGGLLIKEALYRDHQLPTSPANKVLSKACCGIMFFGVPHHGILAEHLLDSVLGRPNEGLARELVVGQSSQPSSLLRRSTDDFTRIFSDRFRIVSFFERSASPILRANKNSKLEKTGDMRLLVTEESATALTRKPESEGDIIGVNKDHSGLVKYASPGDRTFANVVRLLKDLVAQARTSIPVSSYSEQTRDRQIRPTESPIPFSNYQADEVEAEQVREIRDSLQVQDFSGGTPGCPHLLRKLLKRPDFIGWSEIYRKRNPTRNRFLHIHGREGTGKTALMKSLVGHFQRREKQDNQITLRYFFDPQDGVGQNTPTSLCRSFLSQLYAKADLLQAGAQQDLPRHDNLRMGNYDLSCVTYSLFHILKQTGDQPVFIFIDDIDSCISRADTNIDQLRGIFQGLLNGTNAQICLSTGRSYRTNHFSNDAHLSPPWDISNENGADLRDFVCDDVTSLQGLRELYIDKIVNLIVSQAENSFVWAQAMTKNVRMNADNKTGPEIISALSKSLPCLDDAYQRLWDSIDENERPEGLLFLRLAAFSARPLTAAEVRSFLACSKGKRERLDLANLEVCKVQRRIHDSTGGLLELRSRSDNGDDASGPRDEDTVHFINLYAKKFFIRSQQQPNTCSPNTHHSLHDDLEVVDAHLAISSLCLAVICIAHEKKSQAKSPPPALDYSGQFWTLHTRKGWQNNNTTLAGEEVESVDGPWVILECCSRGEHQLAVELHLDAAAHHAYRPGYDGSYGIADVPSPCFLPSERPTDRDRRGRANKTCGLMLQILAVEGCHYFIQRHLSKCNHHCHRYSYDDQTSVLSRAFFLACQRGCMATARLLRSFEEEQQQQQPANPSNNHRVGGVEHAQYLKGRNSPLFIACSKGNERLASLLVTWGADILQPVDHPDQTPLFGAVASGYCEVVRVILPTDRRARERFIRFRHFKHRQDRETTVIHEAVARGNKDMLLELLKYHPEMAAAEMLNLRDGNGQTALDIVTSNLENLEEKKKRIMSRERYREKSVRDIDGKIEDHNHIIDIVEDRGGKTGAEVGEEGREDSWILGPIRDFLSQFTATGTS